MAERGEGGQGRRNAVWRCVWRGRCGGAEGCLMAAASVMAKQSVLLDFLLFPSWFSPPMTRWRGNSAALGGGRRGGGARGQWQEASARRCRVAAPIRRPEHKLQILSHESPSVSHSWSHNTDAHVRTRLPFPEASNVCFLCLFLHFINKYPQSRRSDL